MTDINSEDLTTEQVENDKPAHVPNPEGRGGFGDNPQNINYGGRPKNQDSFTYWLNYFKNLTVNEFKNWAVENPDSERTVAASIAYIRISKARGDLNEYKDVADRTEGKAPQTIVHKGGFFLESKLEIEEVETEDETETEQETEVHTSEDTE